MEIRCNMLSLPFSQMIFLLVLHAPQVLLQLHLKFVLWTDLLRCCPLPCSFATEHELIPIVCECAECHPDFLASSRHPLCMLARLATSSIWVHTTAILGDDIMARDLRRFIEMQAAHFTTTCLHLILDWVSLIILYS